MLPQMSENPAAKTTADTPAKAATKEDGSVTSAWDMHQHRLLAQKSVTIRSSLANFHIIGAVILSSSVTLKSCDQDMLAAKRLSIAFQDPLRVTATGFAKPSFSKASRYTLGDWG